VDIHKSALYYNKIAADGIDIANVNVVARVHRLVNEVNPAAYWLVRHCHVAADCHTIFRSSRSFSLNIIKKCLHCRCYNGVQIGNGSVNCCCDSQRSDAAFYIGSIGGFDRLKSIMTDPVKGREMQTAESPVQPPEALTNNNNSTNASAS
jgi:hypothetical protein